MLNIFVDRIVQATYLPFNFVRIETGHIMYKEVDLQTFINLKQTQTFLNFIGINTYFVIYTFRFFVRIFSQNLNPTDIQNFIAVQMRPWTTFMQVCL